MQNTVDLGGLLPYSKGAAPKPSLQKLERSSTFALPHPQIETNRGVNWYPRFLPSYGMGLMDAVSSEELKKRLIVCMNVPGTQKPRESRAELELSRRARTSVEKTERYFSSWASPTDFLKYIQPVSKENWCFFEYILGDQAQKLYFDVDMTPEKLEVFSKTHQKFPESSDLERIAADLLDHLINSILETFIERGIILDFEKNILIFTSHSKTKKSFHVVIDGYAVLNHKENFILANEVFETIPDEHLQFIDRGMYSSKQQFRLFQSQKLGSGRPKVFLREWSFRGRPVRSTAADNLADENLKLTSLFLMSCVSYTKTCQLLPPVLKEDEHFDRKSLSATNEITDEIAQAIEERLPESLLQIFQVGQVQGSLITLRRKRPSNCPICHTNPNDKHESDNAFLTVNNRGEVRFHCHGFRRHRKPGDISSLEVVTIPGLYPEPFSSHASSYVKSLSPNECQALQSNQKGIMTFFEEKKKEVPANMISKPPSPFGPRSKFKAYTSGTQY